MLLTPPLVVLPNIHCPPVAASVKELLHQVRRRVDPAHLFNLVENLPKTHNMEIWRPALMELDPAKRPTFVQQEFHVGRAEFSRDHYIDSASP